MSPVTPVTTDLHVFLWQQDSFKGTESQLQANYFLFSPAEKVGGLGKNWV